jgi:hypothetical protein
MHNNNQFSKGFEIETKKQINTTILKLMADFDGIVLQRDSAVAERDSAVAERDSAVAERDSAVAERDSAVAERDSAVAERDSISSSTIWKLFGPYRKLMMK